MLNTLINDYVIICDMQMLNTVIFIFYLFLMLWTILNLNYFEIIDLNCTAKSMWMSLSKYFCVLWFGLVWATQNIPRSCSLHRPSSHLYESSTPVGDNAVFRAGFSLTFLNNNK